MPVYGGIAQLGEHLLCKQGVIGSSPIISTIKTWIKYSGSWVFNSGLKPGLHLENWTENDMKKQGNRGRNVKALQTKMWNFN